MKRVLGMSRAARIAVVLSAVAGAVVACHDGAAAQDSSHRRAAVLEPRHGRRAVDHDSTYWLALVQDVTLPARIEEDSHGTRCWRTHFAGHVRLTSASWAWHDSAVLECPERAPQTIVKSDSGIMRVRRGVLSLFSRSSVTAKYLEMFTVLVVRDTLYLNNNSDVRGGDVYLRKRRASPAAK